MFHLFPDFSSSLSEHLPPLQCTYHIALHHFLISFYDYFNWSLSSSWVIQCFITFPLICPICAIYTDVSYFKIYSSMTLPAEFCNFKIFILKVLSKIFHSFDLETHLPPFSFLLTTFSFYFVKVSFIEEWVKFKVS